MFGQTGNTSFGGFSAPTQSSPFAQSAFGKPASTASFGTGSTTVFGSNNTSLFAAKPAGATTGNLFGSTTATPAFGQPATTQSSFGGFGAAQPNTSLFGTQQNANTSLFGTGGTTSAFGQANKPAGFGFGGTTGSSLFGQPQQTVQQTTPFGQTNTQANTSLFGGPAGFRPANTAAGITGTGMVKFNPVTGTDTMVKNGVTQNISTRHHCIICMKEYESKSLEELRLEDYTAGLKGPAQQGQTGGLFGAPAQPAPFGNTGAITSTVSTGFGNMSSAFGATNQSATNTGLFGKPVANFGAPTTTTSAFAFNPTTSSGLFGTNTQAKPFGAAAPSTLFSNTNTTQPAASAFGTMNNTQNPGFGGFVGQQQNQNIGLFNQAKPAFNIAPATSNTGFVFGPNTPASTSTSLFGAKPIGTTAFGNGSAFGTTTAPAFGVTPGFGQTANTSTSLFNSSFKPATQPTGFSFGNTTAAPSALGTNTGMNLGGGSLFGQNKPGGMFAGSTTGTTFNSTGPFGTSGGFGNTTNNAPGLNLSSGGMGGNQIQQNSSSALVHQQILALVSSPFGDSPLLKNLLPASGKAEQILKPANPTAKSLSNSQYKISTTSQNSPKVRARVVTPAQLSKKSLFDGLEEEDPTLLEAFQPRPNAKRLVLRPKSLSSSPAVVSDGNINSTRNNETIDETVGGGGGGSSTCNNDAEPIDKENYQQGNRQPGGDRRSSTSWLKSHLPRAKITEEDFDGQKSPFNSLEILEDALENTVTEFRKHATNAQGPSKGQTNSPANVSLNCSLGADKSGEISAFFNDSSREFDESPLSPLQNELEPNLAKVTLRRVGYYTNPPIDQLDEFVRGETCIVPNFTVGRRGYGNVYFPDSIDIYGMNLDEIVHFRNKEVTIYPDDEKKPPVGQGLNRRAQVTLDKVWPHDKNLHEPITDPHRLTAMNYEGKLRKVSAKYDTRFLEYRPETGSWVFKVDHFSKYGLGDSDDEDDDVQIDSALKKLKGAQMNQLLQKKSVNALKQAEAMTNGLKIEKTVINSLNSGAMETDKESEKNWLFRADDSDDESMSDSMDQPESTIEKQSAMSPTSIYARLAGTDSHKLQLMKASFFDTNGDEFNETSIYGDSEMSQKPVEGFEKYGDMSDYHSHHHVGKIRSNLTLQQEISFKGQAKESFNDSKDFKLKLIHDIKPEKQVTTMNKFFPPPIVHPTTVVLKYKCEVVPLKDSICQQLNFQPIADIGIQMGRKFKPSWGPGLTLVSLSSQEQASIVPLHNSFTQIETYVSGRMEDDNTSTNVVQRLKILGGRGSDNDYIQQFKESIESHLRIQLNHCVIGQEGNCPWIRPGTGETGIAALHEHCDLALEIADDHSGSDNLAVYSHDVWQLCAALWGNLPAIEAGSDAENHENVMIRREAFGEWLKAVVEETVQDEISKINEHDRMMLCLLSANKLEDACELARKTGDYTLALLMSQLGGASSVKELLKQTIALWQATDVVNDVSMDRLKIYMLGAGEQLISCNDEIINVCEDLDWKRALAIHFWYLSSPTASITDILELYESSFNDDGNQVYAAPPIPTYKDEDLDVENFGTKKTYDLCYHLLKLYSTGNHPLEELLNPMTHTADPLDYRLSWLLQQVVVGLGYSHLSDHVAALTHSNFAAQLEAADLWHWAIFVILHLNNSGTRKKAVLDLLARHVQIDEDPDYLERETFLIEELDIPSMWINEAKAIKGCAMKRYGEAAWYLLQAELWNRAHEIIVEYLAADAVINENYEYLKSLLSPLVPSECNSLVNGWAYQGQLLWEYMEIALEIEEFLKISDYSKIGYKLEMLQPQLSSLCTKINQFPCPTAKLRLCQAEIAKRTLHLARSLLLLQPNEDRSTAQVLVHLVSQLPLPEDYAQQELRPIVNMCVNEIVGH